MKLKYLANNLLPVNICHATRVVYMAGLLLLPIATVCAITKTGSMPITATVPTTCKVGASSLAFGSVTSTAIQSGNINGTGIVTITCTNGSPYTIALDAGSASGATLSVRKMSSGVSRLNYSIYTTAARTTIWGNGTSGSSTVAGTGSGITQGITAYGRIFSGQVVPAAAYVDTIVVTVTY